MREVLGLILGRDIGYPGFSWISSVPAEILRDSKSISPTISSFQVLFNAIFTNHPAIWSYTFFHPDSITHEERHALRRFYCRWKTLGLFTTPMGPTLFNQALFFVSTTV
jgi:hypothetical protein